MAGTVRAIILAAFSLWPAHALAQPGPLQSGFESPPASAKPRVWWHWVDGNVSWQGASQDLDWMNRVGIAGAEMVDASLGGPLVVPERVGYMTPVWRDTFRRSVERAASLGMEFSIGSSPGWSLTGGPWVKPEQAMKKFVWSEITLVGGKRASLSLPQPPSIAGPFQDMPAGNPGPAFYRDVAVVAFPATPGGDSLRPSITTSSGALDAARLSDGKLAEFQDVPFDASGGGWVRFDFPRPQTVRALSFVVGRLAGYGPFPATGPGGRLEASDDGKTWRKLADLPTEGADAQTIAFAPTTARQFRLVLTAPHSNAPAMGPPPPPPTAFRIAELVLHADARVHRWEDKAGFSAEAGLPTLATPAGAPGLALKRSDVIDLTSKLRADGRLDWTPPAGRWIVLRFGYSLVGTRNNPASPEGTGLEVDKLSARHVKAYMDAYLGNYEKLLGPDLMGARGLRAVNVDSWESGVQNWTDDMPAQFKRRRGYDLTAWLPALTGRVIEDAPATERFLWDFRTTIGDLTVDEHFGQIARSVHDRGLTSAVESHEQARVFIADGMAVRKFADAPMAAMWIEEDIPGRSFAREVDVREAASTAHLWGRPIVAAESFTALGNPHGYAPADIKPTADKMLALGVNRFFIHSSTHQPLDGAGPGVSLGPFGLWFTRRETWADMAAPFLTYLARGSYLLQQGQAVSDIAYFYGEDDNTTALYGGGLPGLPDGYAWDFINADSLLNVLSVKDGRLVTPGGMSYRMLVLGPESRRMTLPVLKKLRDLVAQGAMVIGDKPQTSPSQSDDPKELRRIADALWASSSALAKKVRSGDVGKALDALGVPADFTYSRPLKDTRLMYAHRAIADGDIYFISNRNARAEKIDLRFRVAGKAPDFWSAETGARVAASYRVEGGQTVVPVELAANGSVFVIFQRPTTVRESNAPRARSTAIATLAGPWDVRFPPGAGAPLMTQMGALASWTQDADPGMRYFSGIATYAYDLPLPASALDVQGRRLVLNLGEVRNIAEVRINGQLAGTAWTAPLEVDVTGLLKQGENHVEIRVANLWPNRLIGDRQPGAGPSGASATFDPFPPNAPLAPSGLLGPVQLRAVDAH